MLRERDTLSEVLYCIGLGPLAGEHEDSTVGPVQMRRDESRRDVASLPNGASPPADLTLCWHKCSALRACVDLKQIGENNQIF